jgi:flagellin-like protein
MRKLRKNAKALSPVVASIILIAVTVAVSIAVAAWMGALSIGFMETEQMSITNTQFESSDDINNDQIVLTVRNTGTADIVVSSATVNGESATVTMWDADMASADFIEKNSEGTVIVTLETTQYWDSGATYQIRLLSAKGNYFPYNAVSP